MTESTGTKLKNLRLQKGLSLEEAHKKTKIHLNILKAIEEDSLVNFSPVYIKGFLKIYCKFLGIDPHDCIPDYKESQVLSKHIPDLEGKSVSSFKLPSFKFSWLKAIHIKPKILVAVAAIFLLIIGLFNLGKFISLKFKTSRHMPKRAEMPVNVVPRPENKAAVVKLQEPVVARTIALDIHAKENCFMLIKCDGRVMFQNILKKGRSESWQAKDRIELSLGNAGVVEIEVNGKRISGLGRKGQALKNILITREGLSVKR